MISHAPYAEGGKAGIAKSFARIHWQNRVNFGVLPLTCADPSDYDHLQPGDTIRIVGVAQALTASREIRLQSKVQTSRYGCATPCLSATSTSNWQAAR